MGGICKNEFDIIFIRGTFVEQTWNGRETIVMLVWNTCGTVVEHFIKWLWNLRGTLMNDWVKYNGI